MNIGVGITKQNEVNLFHHCAKLGKWGLDESYNIITPEHIMTIIYGGKGKPKGKPKGAGKGKGKGIKGECWTCGQTGHKAQNCPKGTGKAGNGKENGKNGNPLKGKPKGGKPLPVCENCCKTGHLTNNCWNPKGNGRSINSLADHSCQPCLPYPSIIQPGHIPQVVAPPCPGHLQGIPAQPLAPDGFLANIEMSKSQPRNKIVQIPVKSNKTIVIKNRFDELAESGESYTEQFPTMNTENNRIGSNIMKNRFQKLPKKETQAQTKQRFKISTQSSFVPKPVIETEKDVSETIRQINERMEQISEVQTNTKNVFKPDNIVNQVCEHLCGAFVYEDDSQRDNNLLPLSMSKPDTNGEDGWKLVSIIIDSGASDSVAPPNAFPVPIHQTDASIAGLCYTAAGGQRIPNEGASGPILHTASGGKYLMTFQIAAVTKILGAVNRIVSAGNRVVFDDPTMGGGGGGGVLH